MIKLVAKIKHAKRSHRKAILKRPLLLLPIVWKFSWICVQIIFEKQLRKTQPLAYLDLDFQLFFLIMLIIFCWYQIFASKITLYYVFCYLYRCHSRCSWTWATSCFCSLFFFPSPLQFQQTLTFKLVSESHVYENILLGVKLSKIRKADGMKKIYILVLCFLCHYMYSCV